MDYVDWNRVLMDHFFRVRDRPTPVYLSVDDALLAELISGKREAWTSGITAASDFQAAIRTMVFGRDPFQGIAVRTRDWRRHGAVGDPPFIAVLAATVLAASRMARPDGELVGKFSYYRPLRQILGLNGADGMPDGYDEVVPALWKHLKWWLAEHEHGHRGLPSSIPHPTQVYIGWSLSQAVLLGGDRAQVGLFFSAIGVQPGDTISEAELLARFEEWSRVARVGPRVQRALQVPQLKLALASILQQELHHYDGLARDAAGTPVLPLSLTSADGGEPFGVAARVPVGLRISEISLAGKSIAVHPGNEWVRLPGSAATPEPGVSLQLESDSSRLIFPARDCYVFQSNEIIGKWTSVNVAEIGIPHRVLVKNTYAKQAEEVMLACGSGPVKRPRRVQVPTGWTLFSAYCPARSTTVSGALGPLSPLHQQLARLAGGLRVEGGRHTFLAGHAPDLVFPAASDIPPQDITLNGQRLSVDVSSATATIRLANLALQPGDYQVMVGARRLNFTLVSRFREAVVPPALGLLSRGDNKLPMRPSRLATDRIAGHQSPMPYPDYVSGASFDRTVRASLPPMTPLRLGGSIYALGQRRTAAKLVSETPGWIAPPMPPAQVADLEALLAMLPFQALWVLRVSWDGNRTVDRAPVVRHGAYGLASGSWCLLATADWRDLVAGGLASSSAADGVEEDWSQYASGG